MSWKSGPVATETLGLCQLEPGWAVARGWAAWLPLGKPSERQTRAPRPTPSPLTLGTDAHCLGLPPSPAEGQHCAPGTETIFKPRVKPTGVAAGWSGLSLVPTRVDTFDSCRVTRFITGHYGGRSVRPVREPVSCRVKRTQSGGSEGPRRGTASGDGQRPVLPEGPTIAAREPAFQHADFRFPRSLKKVAFVSSDDKPGFWKLSLADAASSCPPRLPSFVPAPAQNGLPLHLSGGVLGPSL